ncbi:MAG TPA: hypothetical protein DGG94_16295 [Micromonosporaceae bacterium]|nr:hypothetical protein [Micromonosporaceae bacterium]HCU51331.1 hypothetical protein [Micromonosporaceae bacterium]
MNDHREEDDLRALTCQTENGSDTATFGFTFSLFKGYKWGGWGSNLRPAGHESDHRQLSAMDFSCTKDAGTGSSC